jgi:hypothetical protein
MGLDLFRHGGRKTVAVDGQRAAGRNLVGVAAGHDQRAGKPHFGMQQADRVGLGVVGTKGIGADEFGETVGLVGVGPAHAAHFVQDHGDAGLRGLPGSFAAGKAAADDVYWFCVHGLEIVPARAECNRPVDGRGQAIISICRTAPRFLCSHDDGVRVIRANSRGSRAGRRCRLHVRVEQLYRRDHQDHDEASLCLPWL